MARSISYKLLRVLLAIRVTTHESERSSTMLAFCFCDASLLPLLALGVGGGALAALGDLGVSRLPAVVAHAVASAPGELLVSQRAPTSHCA